MNLGLSLGLGARAVGGGGFNPASLFTAGEQGVWYDPSDFSTMYQTNDTSTPVTAVGQSVGRIEDKSGNGNHATQATAARRPQYQVYSKPVLNGDFVDDNMTFNGSTMTACESAYVTENGWMVGGASGSNYGSLSRIPLGRVTQYIVNPNILTNADRLSAYFGVDQYYFVGMTTNSAVFHGIDSPAGAYPITYVGANGVAYTHTENYVMTDLIAQGLTSPFTMLVPKAVLSDNQMTAFYCNNNQLTGSIPSLSANTALTQFGCDNNQLTGSIPSLSANTALWVFYCNNNQLTGSIPSLSANTALTQFVCDINQLTGSIPSLSANTALTQFGCNDNQLTGWSGGTVSATLGDFRAGNNLLTQAAVDAILAAFVAAGRTLGSLDLGGTGNAAPSAAGLADKATLQSRGWAVTTN